VSLCSTVALHKHQSFLQSVECRLVTRLQKRKLPQIIMASTIKFIILNELPLVTDADERGNRGEIKESYFSVNILYTCIISPLILLNLRVGRLRILSLGLF